MLLAALAVLASCGGPVQEPEARVVAYLDDDHAVARRVFDEFRRHLVQSRPAAAPPERYEFIAARPTESDSIRQGLARARALRPSLVVATSWPLALAARDALGGTPVLFMSHPDPVQKKLVDDLAAPGGHMSGVTFHMPLDLKRVELLREILPRARTLGILCDRWFLQLEDSAQVVEQARQRFGFDVYVLEVDDPAEAARRLGQAPFAGVEAWYVPDSLLSFTHGDAILALFAQRRLPAVYGPVSFAERGGIAALYPRARAVQQRLPVLARMVLEGTSPGRIPVEKPIAVTLAVNLEAATRAGISLPPGVLRRADRIHGAVPTAP